jgi:flagellar biosynthesis protein FliR
MGAQHGETDVRRQRGFGRETRDAARRCRGRNDGVEGLFEEVARAFSLGGSGGGLARGFFRLLPTVFVVPAFGLRGVPIQVRASMALVLAFAVAPAISTQGVEPGGLAVTLFVDVLRGLPLALASALPLWAGTMAGGLFDELRGPSADVKLAPTPDAHSPSAVLLSLLGGFFFFAAGGPSTMVRAIVRADVDANVVTRTVSTLAAGASIALVVAGPLLAAAILSTAAGAMVARSPFFAARAVVPSLRAVAMLAFFAVALERVATLLALVTAEGIHKT